MVEHYGKKIVEYYSNEERLSSLAEWLTKS
jgi:hypothetical protein